MQTYICVLYESVPYKLIWCNEDRTGVYIGWYGSISGAHFSYHADGTSHLKRANRKRMGPSLPMPSIAQIHQAENLVSHAIDLDLTSIKLRGSEFRAEEKSTCGLFLYPGVFRAYRRIWFSTMLAHKTWQHNLTDLHSAG